MSNNGLNRDSLLKLVNLVRPALSAMSFIPAYQHILFADGFVTAYNDVTAIMVSDSAVDGLSSINEGCIPGELLIKALSSFNAEKVLIQGSEERSLTSGRSKLKIPALPVKSFPFKLPSDKDAPVLELNDEIINGIKRCLFGVGTDTTHPAQMGVTLDVDGKGYAVLYATDNATITRQQTKSKIELPGDSPVILPTFFCDQLMTLSKAYPEEDIDLELHDGALLVHFGKKARLFSKTVVDMMPLEFARIIKNFVDVDGDLNLVEIPDSFDAAWNRALLVLSAEVDKATQVTIEDKFVDLLSKSTMGEAGDELEFSEKLPRVSSFYVNPALVIRAAKQCDSVAFFAKTMVMAKDKGAFLHLISHSAA